MSQIVKTQRQMSNFTLQNGVVKREGQGNDEAGSRE